jgi:phosphohistidine swiveling domain-containing protein
MNYKDINSKHYDFLWTIGDFPPFFISTWLHEEYLKRDFLYTYKDDIWSLYISIEERKKLAKEGLSFLLNKFDKYKKLAEKQVLSANLFFEKSKTTEFDKLDNKIFSKKFIESMELVKSLWKNYFWVEYHNFDELARVIQENDVKYNIEKLKVVLDKASDLKFQLRQCLNKSFYPPSYFDPLYKELPKRLNLTEEKTALYSYKEIYSLLNGKTVKFQDRSISVCGKFSDWKYIVGNEAGKIISQLNCVSRETTKIKGSVGNKGNYTGKVKIINFSLKTNFNEKINTMNNGDVLVSGSTGPEMILACKKAGAIVTDEGGIISHAAIVSRELGIPSIIGTKIATKVLKDGDLVEVDANNGIVTILKRAKKN